MKTRSTHIGGWRWRLRIFDWPLLCVGTTFVALVTVAVIVAYHLASAS